MKMAAIVTLVLLLVLLVGCFIYWQPARALARKQIELEKSIDSKKTKRFKKLIAESYKDRWNFSADDLAVTMVDIRTQYIILNLQTNESKWSIDGPKATLLVKYRVDGQPKTPAANTITQEANKLKTPMMFTWEKQSILPWSWKLTSFDNTSIPDDAHGYQPGDLTRAMENLNSF